MGGRRKRRKGSEMDLTSGKSGKGREEDEGYEEGTEEER